MVKSASGKGNCRAGNRQQSRLDIPQAKVDIYYWILFIVLLSGLVIRLLFLSHFKDTAFFNPAVMEKYDQQTFFLWADDIRAHPWYVDGKPFYMAPFYPYALAVSQLLFGGNLVAVAAFQLMLDTVLCLMLFMIGSALVDRRTGLLAAAFAAFYATFIIYAASILSDGFITLLFVGFFLLVQYAVRTRRPSSWIGSGIVFGLGLLAKPTLALFLPFLLIGLFVCPEKRLLLSQRRGRTFNILAAFSLLLAGAVVTVLPVTIRNFCVSGRFIPICSNGLINWQIGNSADSLGLFCYPQGPVLSLLTGDFWRLFCQKLVLFCTSYEWPQNLNVYLVREVVPFIRIAVVPFGFIVPTGLAGLVLLLMADWRKHFLFVSFVISNILWVVLFFIVDRYRLPAVACLVVSSAYAMVWTFDRFRDKRPVGVLVTWCCIGLFAYFFNATPEVDAGRQLHYKLFFELSARSINYDMLKRNHVAALKKSEDLVRILPGLPAAHYWRGSVRAWLGQKEQARADLQDALLLDPSYGPARDLLSELH